MLRHCLNIYVEGHISTRMVEPDQELNDVSIRRDKCVATPKMDRLCGIVVSVEDYKHRGPGFDSRALFRIFLRELGLERGPLSLVIG
jgi:hypothetical protein